MKKIIRVTRHSLDWVPILEKASLIAICYLLFNCECAADEDIGQVTITMNLPFKTNPSRVWQIGYSADNTLSVDQFRLCTFSDTTDVIGMWHPSSSSDGYYPYTGQNRETSSRVSKSNGWAVEAGQIAMEGSNTGQYSLLRFVVPVTGTYKLIGVFKGVHYGLSSTDVHILVNSTSVLNEIIEGYGGDPKFHTIEGPHPTAPFEKEFTLKKNDIVTFAVGYGPNKTHYNDTTGLTVLIEKK